MDPERFAFAMRHLYVYPRLRLAYTYVPKNACTSLKRTLGKAEGWLGTEAASAHQMRVSWWLSGVMTYPWAEERLVVVRDPFDRLLSAYLNRFLMRTDPVSEQAMRAGLASCLATGQTRGDVTFADFVTYLSRTPSRLLNEHWRPQVDFLIGAYSRIIRFEHLDEDTRFLAQRGCTLAHAQGHATSTLRRDLGPGWAHRPARVLRRVRRRQGCLPTRENMYDDRLTALIADRFAGDLEFWDRASGRAIRSSAG